MPIPPHRAPGDVGHINDHNDISDTLTSHELRTVTLEGQMSGHLTANDPHGAKAYADATKAPIGHTHGSGGAVDSVNGQIGTVVLTAASVGAVATSLMGVASGVATLDSGGKVPTAQLPSGGGGSGFDPGWENVKDYGATGDGTTDDTTAINNAITAAQTGTRKRPVYFPYGTYKLSSAIVLADGLQLIGEVGHGKEFDRRVNITNTASDMFTWGGSGAADSSQRPKDMFFGGITFSGSTSRYFITPSPMDASGAYPQDLTITYCGIKNFNTIFNSPALRLKIADSYLNSCATTPLSVGGSDNQIERCFIDTYVPGSQGTNAVVYLNCQESSFTNNYVTHAPSMGIKVGSHSAGLRIVNNTINGLAQSSSHGGFTYPEGPSVYVTSGADGVVIVGNAFCNSCNAPWTSGSISYDGVVTIVDASACTVTGNTFYNTKSSSAYHIRIRRTTGTVNQVKVYGNTYLTDSGAETPRIAKAGTMTNVVIDDELAAGTVSSVNGATGAVTITPATLGAQAVIDVTHPTYGADRTGVADSRAAIQAAINAAATAGGGIVYLPRGTYKIGYVANADSTGAAGGLQMKTNVWLKGEGPATRLEATGTWSSQAGIIAIGDRVTSRNPHDCRISDMWIKGTAGTSYAGTPPANIHGILFNTASISGEPDAVHKIHDLLIWDCEVGLALLGTDDQAMQIHDLRIRHTLRQGVLVGKEDGSGGGPDNYFSGIDVSAANMLSGGTYAGFEIYSSNNHFTQCKSWYNKRNTTYSSAATYKDGAGWFVKATRNIFTSCEAQDNGGHGWLLNFGKNTFTSCVADSNNYFDNISGSALANQCVGFYVTSGSSDTVIEAAMAFDRNSTATNRYQKYGYQIDAASRNVKLTGTAWDNRSTSSATDPADGVSYINGAAHSSHEVKVMSAYGSTRSTISNP